MNPNKLLEEIGLSSNEAKVYLAVLKLKKGLISPIAKEAGVNRTTAYDILEYLNKKRLILKYIENNKIGYTTEGPQKIKNWLTDKENQLYKQKEIFQQNLNALKHIYYAKPDSPKFKYFEDKESLEDFFNDSLDSLSGEIIGYAAVTLSTSYASERYIRQFAKHRAQKKIKGRYFIQETDKESALKYMQKYYQKYLEKNPDLLQIKVLPTKEEKHFINETSIYDNKFAISHLGKDFFGVIIEDEDVANTQRMIFNVLWKLVKTDLKID